MTATRSAVTSLLTSLLFLSLIAGVAGAQSPVDGPFLSFGQTQHEVDVFRAGLRFSFPGAVCLSDVGYVSGHVETGLLYWANGDETAYGVVLAPLAAYYFGGDAGAFRPYVGGGIGASYLSESRMGVRDLGSHFQFEDRIGLGVEWSRFDLNLSVVHYSNGSIKPPNEGLEAVILTLAWSPD